MSDILKKICDSKLEHVKKCQEQKPLAEIKAEAKAASPARGFEQSLRNAKNKNACGLIAEIKKASPSKGLIREDFNPAEIAKAYEAGGASCLSVLTDEPYFQGNNEYLIEARNACNLPVLRKDFMLDPYQVIEARAIGADCILLIMAALELEQALELESTAKSYNMDVLIEVHNEEELQQGLNLNSKLIGVNNRNLKTLSIDLLTSEILAQNIPDNYLIVSESGLETPEDLKRMKNIGINTFLIGTSLMKQDDIELATKSLLT